MIKYLSIILMAWAGQTYANAPELQLPLDCKLGHSCFIQQYMDHDTSKGVQDYTCGSATYDGHKGTDFRLPTLQDMHDGVNVLAAAAGRVSGVRNDMADHIMRTDQDRAKLKGRECGNGLVIDHGNGWQTQYCHMKQGSISLTKGALIVAGQVLGLVGLSGQTQFPHLHLSVRHKGEKIDPFDDPNDKSQNCMVPQGNMWVAEHRAELAYNPTQIINLGFADQVVKQADIDAKTFEGFKLERTTPVFIAYFRMINLQKGDGITLTLKGPQNITWHKAYDPMPKNRAVQMYFMGKKAPRGGWPVGDYSVQVQIKRGGAQTEQLSHKISLK